MKLKIVAFTDNNALKESLYSFKTIEEKRLLRFLENMRESLENKEISIVKWINTKAMLADVLTKEGVIAENLRNILRTGKLTHSDMMRLMTMSCGEKL